MVMFWVAILAISILLYVLLDGFDLGVGMLFGLTGDETQTARDVERGGADLGRQRDLAGRRRGGPVGGISDRLCDAVLGVLSAAAADAGGTDPARRGVRISLQDRAAALDVGCRVCRRIAGRDVHAGLDRRRPGEGVADHRRPVYRRRIRLVQPVCGAVRHRPVPRLRAARRLLAGQKMRRRGPRRGLSPDPLSLGRPARLPDRRLRLRLGREPSGHAAAGSSGPICSSSRRSGSSRRSCSPSAFVTAGTGRHSTWWR